MMATMETVDHLLTHHNRSVPSGAAVSVHHDLHSQPMTEVDKIPHYHPGSPDAAAGEEYLGRPVPIGRPESEPEPHLPVLPQGPALVYLPAAPGIVISMVDHPNYDFKLLDDRDLALLAALCALVEFRVEQEQAERGMR